jgi:ureidoacrylate peracid hydrolase
MKPYEKMNSSNTALIVIDVVNGCCNEKCEEGSMTFSRIRQMVPALNLFMKQFKEKTGAPVIFVKIAPWTKEYLPENLQELYTDPKAYFYSDDTSGFPEEFYEIRPNGDDITITKNTYDAFADPNFREILKKKGVRYLVVTGVFTDGCVLATICGGFQAGYNFVILKDLIETTDQPERQELSQRLKNYTFPILYGKTIESKEFLESWE